MEMSVATTLLLTFLTAPNFLFEFTRGQGTGGCYSSNAYEIDSNRLEYRCFGPEGRYRCLCALNGRCDGNNGSCLDKPSGCSQGRSGSSCRRKNLSARYMSRLTDGDDSTCNQGYPYVDVRDLNLSTVIVTADKGDFSLELRTEPNRREKMVRGRKRLPGNRYWFPVQENNFIYLFFRSSAGQVSICEVRLFDCEENWFGPKCDKQCHCNGSCDRALGHCTGGCESGWSGDSCQRTNYENVAVNKPAWQTSVYVNDLLFKNVRNTSYPAQLAVDGDPDGYFNHLSCTHTAAVDHNPEWTVDLGPYYTISWIRIHNRLSSRHRYRLTGFKVYVSNSSSSSGELCFNETGRNKSGQVIIDIHCEPSIRGRYVKITKTTEFLTLCEVGIMRCKPGWRGDYCQETCSSGYYGRDCKYKCPVNCKANKCDHISGHCTEGCRPGFVGDKCNSSCSPGSYGANCTGRCVNCKNNRCNHLTGNCTEGCSPGFVGDKCNSSCPHGSFGQECVSSCSINCRTNRCDHITGSCDDGCKPGFVDDKCTVKCSRGSYGSGCKNSCITCENENCNYISGTCIDGCKSGFLDDDCKRECPENWFGTNCYKLCRCKNGEICNKENGHCPSGCATGWTGSDCQQSKNEVNWSAVGVTLAFGSAMLVIVAAIIKGRGMFTVCKIFKPHEPKDEENLNEVHEYEHPDVLETVVDDTCDGSQYESVP